MPVLAGQSIRAIVLDQGTYTPVLTATTTNPTLGSGSTQSGVWKRIDNLVIGWAFIRFGTSGSAAGSGTYFISLPFAADTTYMIGTDSGGTGSVIGCGEIRDNSVPTIYFMACQLAGDAAHIRMYRDNVTSAVTDAVPVVFAINDAFSINFQYQADPTAF